MNDADSARRSVSGGSSARVQVFARVQTRRELARQERMYQTDRNSRNIPTFRSYQNNPIIVAKLEATTGTEAASATPNSNSETEVERALFHPLLQIPLILVPPRSSYTCACLLTPPPVKKLSPREKFELRKTLFEVRESYFVVSRRSMLVRFPL